MRCMNTVCIVIMVVIVGVTLHIQIATLTHISRMMLAAMSMKAPLWLPRRRTSQMRRALASTTTSWCRFTSSPCTNLVSPHACTPTHTHTHSLSFSLSLVFSLTQTCTLTHTRTRVLPNAYMRGTEIYARCDTAVRVYIPHRFAPSSYWPNFASALPFMVTTHHYYTSFYHDRFC